MMAHSATDQPPEVRFSIVICTHNRERFLQATLESALAQEYRAEDYEVIVVDNDSTDGTRALIERAQQRAAVPLAYELERRPGVSFARNLGMARARHDYVAYLDDDTIAPPGWLAAYNSAIRSHGALALGGPVAPVLEPGVLPPVWWSLRAVRSVFEVAHETAGAPTDAMTLRWPLWLGGCNAAYARLLLIEHGGFSENCGPVGARYRVAEDIELNARLERAGVPIFYVRDAAIRHRITADRLTRRYLWRRAVSAGVTDAAAAAVLGERPRAPGALQLAGAALRFVLNGEPARTAAVLRLAYGIGHLRARMSRTGALNEARAAR